MYPAHRKGRQEDFEFEASLGYPSSRPDHLSTGSSSSSVEIDSGKRIKAVCKGIPLEMFIVTSLLVFVFVLRTFP